MKRHCGWHSRAKKFLLLKVLPAKTVIASIGYKENNMLYEQLKDSEIPVYNIGDSRQVHNIMYAIWNAYELARGL